MTNMLLPELDQWNTIERQTIEQEKADCEAFLAAHEDYYATANNWQTMRSWLYVHGI